MVKSKLCLLLWCSIVRRRVFGTTDLQQQHPCDPSFTLLSRPPSPTMRGSVKYARMLLELRKVLGNRVFEDGEGEDDDIDDVEGDGDMKGGGGGGYSFRVLRLGDAIERAKREVLLFL